MKTLILTLLFVIPCAAQLPDISKFKLAGTGDAGHLGAFVDRQGTERNGDKVKFDGLLSPILDVKDGQPFIDPDNFLITTFRADCKTKAFAFVKSKGVRDGKPFAREDEPNTNVAEKGSLILAVIEYVCGERDLKDMPKEGVKSGQ